MCHNSCRIVRASEFFIRGYPHSTESGYIVCDVVFIQYPYTGNYGLDMPVNMEEYECYVFVLEEIGYPLQ